MGSPGLKKKKRFSSLTYCKSLSLSLKPLPHSLPLSLLSKRSAHCKDRLLNIFSLITKKASLLGVIKNHKLASRLSLCESSPAPLATIQTRSGRLTAAVRPGCSPGGPAARGAGLLESLGSVMMGHGIQGISPERSGRRGIDACRQGVRALTSAAGTPRPSPQVPRSPGRGHRGQDGLSVLAVISNGPPDRMEWLLSDFQNHPFNGGRGCGPSVAPEGFDQVGGWGGWNEGRK